MAEYARRRSSVGAAPVANGASLDDPVGLRYPAIVEYLTLTEWEPGLARETSTLLLFTEDGQWKACVHDRDAGKSCFVSSGSLGELLDRVNLGLREDDLEWRDKRPGPARKR